VAGKSALQFIKHFWDKWNQKRNFFPKQGITPENIGSFAFNPDRILPDDIFPNRE